MKHSRQLETRYLKMFSALENSENVKALISTQSLVKVFFTVAHLLQERLRDDARVAQTFWDSERISRTSQSIATWARSFSRVILRDREESLLAATKRPQRSGLSKASLPTCRETTKALGLSKSQSKLVYQDMQSLQAKSLVSQLKGQTTKTV